MLLDEFRVVCNRKNPICILEASLLHLANYHHIEARVESEQQKIFLRDRDNSFIATVTFPDIVFTEWPMWLTWQIWMTNREPDAEFQKLAQESNPFELLVLSMARLGEIIRPPGKGYLTVHYGDSDISVRFCHPSPCGRYAQEKILIRVDLHQGYRELDAWRQYEEEYTCGK